MVVWDVVSESGRYRLRGHKDAVTDVAWLDSRGLLFSSSKDTHVKVWQLDIQSCIQTIVGHRHQVWSLDVSPDETRLITGSADTELKLWDLGAAGEQNGVKSLGNIRRQSKERVVQLRYNSVRSSEWHSSPNPDPSPEPYPEANSLTLTLTLT